MLCSALRAPVETRPADRIDRTPLAGVTIHKKLGGLGDNADGVPPDNKQVPVT